MSDPFHPEGQIKTGPPASPYAGMPGGADRFAMVAARVYEEAAERVTIPRGIASLDGGPFRHAVGIAAVEAFGRMLASDAPRRGHDLVRDMAASLLEEE